MKLLTNIKNKVVGIQRQNSKKGFTLIEVLVSLAVFSLTVSLAAGIYVQVVSVSQTSRATKLIMEEAGYLIDVIGKDVRNNDINYEYYDEESGGEEFNLPTEELSVRLVNGNTKNYFLEQEQVMISPTGQLAVALTSDQVRIERLEFYVLPNENCFPNCSVQEHVTLSFTISSNLPEVGFFRNRTMDFQTTFSSRNYAF